MTWEHAHAHQVAGQVKGKNLSPAKNTKDQTRQINDKEK
jgi:hypothetical protein